MVNQKIYTEEFKREAVRLVESGQSVAQVCDDLGVGHTALYRWRLLYGSRSEQDQAVTTDEELRKENARLRKQVRLLEEEREILKKAAAFFAKENR